MAVVVLRDLPGKQGDGVYLVGRSGMSPVPGWGERPGELNTGDGALLTAFVSFVRDQFPARRYALVLWDHGDGWRRAEQSAPPRSLTGIQADREAGSSQPSLAERPLGLRGVCFDYDGADTVRDFLEVPELREALVQAGLRLDLIGFDACLMGMAEVAYELKDAASVMVASEEVVPGDGWPYDAVLAWLGQNPSADGAALGRAIVSAYAESHSGSLGQCAPVMSAVDLARMADVQAKAGTLAEALQRGYPQYKSGIDRATWECDYFESDLHDYRDLYDFACLVADYCRSSAEISAQAGELMAGIDAAVLEHRVAAG
ncbi:MAG: hypothetical protein H5T97_06160, partial [Firmicutes bacterium]|nr:hypothetical protein [Bacillota bacterium]